MKKTERVDFIMRKLEKLYPETPVPLNHSNLYELLIAVLLSAQCTDERVNKITPQLFKKANSPKKMCKLSIDEIYKIIRPCGLAPQKSKAIYNLSKILKEKFSFQSPFGLPRCVTIIILAFCSRSFKIVGTILDILVESLILSSLIGTFKSTLIITVLLKTKL